MIPKLIDSDMMPFGKYGPLKDDPRQMKDVPASYLHWLWGEGLRDKVEWNSVAGYIKRNLQALIEEHPDGTEWE